MKHALLAASLVLVAGSAAGCGGGGASTDSASTEGAPADASAAGFCGVFEDFYAVVGELGAEAEDSELIAALKDTGEDLEEVGTPEDIPDDARAGFELTVKTIEELDSDATEEELNDLEKEFTAEEKKQSDAFDAYLAETCQESSDPAEPPSEEPSE